MKQEELIKHMLPPLATIKDALAVMDSCRGRIVLVADRAAKTVSS